MRAHHTEMARRLTIHELEARVQRLEEAIEELQARLDDEERHSDELADLLAAANQRIAALEAEEEPNEADNE